MRVIHKHVLMAIVTVSVFIGGTVFVGWGFNPSGWEPVSRAGWLIFGITCAGLAATFPFSEIKS